MPRPTGDQVSATSARWRRRRIRLTVCPPRRLWCSRLWRPCISSMIQGDNPQMPLHHAVRGIGPADALSERLANALSLKIGGVRGLTVTPDTQEGDDDVPDAD